MSEVATVKCPFDDTLVEKNIETMHEDELGLFIHCPRGRTSMSPHRIRIVNPTEEELKAVRSRALIGPE